MRTDEIEDAEEFLEHIEDAEPGDVVVFDEAQGSAPARRMQAEKLKMLLNTDRKGRMQNEDIGTGKADRGIDLAIDEMNSDE